MATHRCIMQGKHEVTDFDPYFLAYHVKKKIRILANHYFEDEQRRNKCIERWNGKLPLLQQAIEKALLKTDLKMEVVIETQIEKFMLAVEEGIKENLNRNKKGTRKDNSSIDTERKKKTPKLKVKKLRNSSHTQIGSKRALVSSTEGVLGNVESKPLSSNELPLGMSNYQFAILCNYLVTHFDKGDFVDKGTEYQPPEFLCFKGSSVTGLSYANAKGAKRFGSHSDYDCILVWEQGIDAMFNLELKNSNLPKNLKLDNSSGLRFLNLHSDDRLTDEKYNVSKRRFFPNGIPHILCCEDLKSKMRTEHPLNFVVLRSLEDIALSDDIVETKSVLDNKEKKKMHRELKHYVFEKREVSEAVKEQLFPHKAKNDGKSGQILVYSWRLIKLYHALYQQEQFKTQKYNAGFFCATKRDRRAPGEIDIKQEMESQLQWVDEISKSTTAIPEHK
ncbi:hypothetical protein LLO_1980 [Legionella longbeachae NSW150]|uniref:Uncharacterized protein n=2 Tax=Legionella longbeachae TaxID=450 RepID=D3HIY3_LEGLN|nr:hypothetical protein LLO_1980 [Legionella longbeachae NSW150]